MRKEARRRKETHLSVDELDVTRALRVAVSRTVFGTGLVGREPGHATVGIHFGEVQSTVQTTGELGDINVEGELLVERLEHLVLGFAGQKVETGADVLLLGLGDELEGQGVSAGGDTVSSGVVGTIEGTVGSTSGVVGAEGVVPGVSGVAVSAAVDGMDVTPVSINDDAALLSRAGATGAALGPGEGGVGLSREGADLLTVGDGEEGETDEGGLGEHGCYGIGRREGGIQLS
jgi:hypothetical protein